MDILLIIGLLLITGYSVGWVLDKIGLPKIVGYIATGICFSPKTFGFFEASIVEATEPLMNVCLSFIAFEAGGSLRWKKVKRHEKEILSITIFESLTPLILVASGVIFFAYLLPALIPMKTEELLPFALLLGALSSPTAPAATIAVMHQYKAKGPVTDTIMGVVALDDIMGILFFSFTLAGISIKSGAGGAVTDNVFVTILFHIIVPIVIGAVSAIAIDLCARIFRVHGDGQWVVIVFSMIILNAGLSSFFKVDMLLSCMTMGVAVVNISRNRKMIFKILERYTEDLIFLFFFLLSGLHLDVTSIPHSVFLICLFVVLRVSGKMLGVAIGAKIANAPIQIHKYTAGGLIPQAGVVIGLVLSIYRVPQFSQYAETLLTTIMGTTIINELMGPIVAKHALYKAGEIKKQQ